MTIFETITNLVDTTMQKLLEPGMFRMFAKEPMCMECGERGVRTEMVDVKVGFVHDYCFEVYKQDAEW